MRALFLCKHSLHGPSCCPNMGERSRQHRPASYHAMVHRHHLPLPVSTLTPTTCTGRRLWVTTPAAPEPRCGSPHPAVLPPSYASLHPRRAPVRCGRAAGAAWATGSAHLHGRAEQRALRAPCNTTGRQRRRSRLAPPLSLHALRRGRAGATHYASRTLTRRCHAHRSELALSSMYPIAYCGAMTPTGQPPPFHQPPSMRRHSTTVAHDCIRLRACGVRTRTTESGAHPHLKPPRPLPHGSPLHLTNTGHAAFATAFGLLPHQEQLRTPHFPRHGTAWAGPVGQSPSSAGDGEPLRHPDHHWWT